MTDVWVHFLRNFGKPPHEVSRCDYERACEGTNVPSYQAPDLMDCHDEPVRLHDGAMATRVVSQVTCVPCRDWLAPRLDDDGELMVVS